jgi:7,8-dihydropterin-6-yl-methyl-4-(beta-D-ribofuranosyl)aminobenzene 5'-phosphate synthase
MKITIVFENRPVKGFNTGWGLSALVETGQDVVLFDTGCSGRDLLQNLEALKVDPSTLNKVVISHSHWDHTGGVFDLVEVKGDIHFYTGHSLSRRFTDEIERRGGTVSRGDGWRKLADDLYITPELSHNVPEQALVILKDEFVTLLLGCSHPGVDRFAALVYGKFKRPMVIIGGFHYFPLSRRQMVNQIKKLEKYPVLMMMPLHCTGQEGTLTLKGYFKVRELATGDVIPLHHLTP